MLLDAMSTVGEKSGGSKEFVVKEFVVKEFVDKECVDKEFTDVTLGYEGGIQGRGKRDRLSMLFTKLGRSICMVSLV